MNEEIIGWVLGFILGTIPGFALFILFVGKSYENGYNQGRKDGWFEGYEESLDDLENNA